MTSEEKIKKIVGEFDEAREEFNGLSYRTRRREWFDKPMEKIKPLLTKERIQNLTMDEAMTIYHEMSVGGPKLFPITFKENGIEKIRNSLSYLLYGEDLIDERFYNFAYNPESEHKLNGVSRAFASTALFLSSPKEYPIWNNAIDGGLDLLGLLPKRERGEHQGKTYVKISEKLKELNKICKFNDLSYTDEFIELIYHGKIGASVLKEETKEKGKELGQDDSKEEEGKTHTKMQWIILKIGIMKGYDVWAAKNDLNKEYNNEKFSSLCLKEVPQFSSSEALSIAQYVDVIWFKKGTTLPISFFEIETTTSVYSGLLRLNDIRIDFPMDKAYIISSSGRKGLFDTQVQRNTFTSSGLDEICGFKTYEEIEEILNSMRKLKNIDL
jgi:hypothetical protein